MKKRQMPTKRIIVVLLTVIICLFMSGKSVYAENTGSTPVVFNIEGIENKHQANKDVSYFYLKEDPEENDTLGIKINNEGDNPLKVSLNVTDANTNANGILDYTGTKKNSKYLKMPLTNYLKARDKEVTVDPHSTKEVYFDLKMPKDKFEGFIVGAINVMDESSTQDTKGMAIKNKYGYTLGVVLTNNGTELNQNISVELDKVKAVLDNGRKVVQADILNPNPYIFKAKTVSAKVTKLGDNKVLNSVEKKNVSIAPYQIFPLQLDWGKRNLKPGKYELVAKVKTDKRTWKFRKVFEIKENTAKKINEKSVFKVSIPTYLNYAVIIIILLNVITTIYIFIRKGKRNGKESKE